MQGRVGLRRAAVRVFGAALPFACISAGAAPAQTAPSASTEAAHDHGASEVPALTRAPPSAYNYIGWPQDGTVIRSPRFRIWFGARNIGVAPADVSVVRTGHHHLLINTPLPANMTVAIPNDQNHLHFGLGQTETMLELPPGTHTLQLLMGDAAHVPHDPPAYSRRITIHVRPGRTAHVPADR